MRRLYLVYGVSDEAVGAEVADWLRASLPGCEVVGRWHPEHVGEPQAWLTSHAVLGVLTQDALTAAEVPFVMGGAEVLEKPVFGLLDTGVRADLLTWSLAPDNLAYLDDDASLEALLVSLASVLEVTIATPVEADSEAPHAVAPEAAPGEGVEPFAGGWVAGGLESWDYQRDPTADRPEATFAPEPSAEPQQPAASADPASTDPTAALRIVRPPLPQMPADDPDPILRAFQEMEEPQDPAITSVDRPAPSIGSGIQPRPDARTRTSPSLGGLSADHDTEVEHRSVEQTQDTWPVAEAHDATALPDSPDADAPRKIPRRSDIAPSPSVLSAEPGCEASLEAGQAFSDCVFHRDQGTPFRGALDVPFGNFVTALGGNWGSLRALDDVDLWMEMADNVLMSLPQDKQYVRWWYEVGFQLATLFNLADVDPSSNIAKELTGTWESSMEGLVLAVRALDMSAGEIAVLEGMLENLRGSGGAPDLLNTKRIEAVIRKHASHADAALSA